jgi:hypothetical protein
LQVPRRFEINIHNVNSVGQSCVAAEAPTSLTSASSVLLSIAASTFCS